MGIESHDRRDLLHNKCTMCWFKGQIAYSEEKHSCGDAECCDCDKCDTEYGNTSGTLNPNFLNPHSKNVCYKYNCLL